MREFPRIPWCRPKKGGLYRKICEKALLAHAFWGDNHYFGSTRPRTALQWHRACYFIWCTILAWGGTILVRGGTSSDLGGTAPECLSVEPGCQVALVRRLRLDLSVLDSSYHLPTCLPHMVEDSRCPL